jgi:hypothetical protein
MDNDEFLSALGSLAGGGEEGSAILKKMIKPNTDTQGKPDGTYTINFNDNTSLVIDSKLPVDQNGNTHGAQVSHGIFKWVALLEKAFMIKYKNGEYTSFRNPPSNPGPGSDLIGPLTNVYDILGNFIQDTYLAAKQEEMNFIQIQSALNQAKQEHSQLFMNVSQVVEGMVQQLTYSIAGALTDGAGKSALSVYNPNTGKLESMSFEESKRIDMAQPTQPGTPDTPGTPGTPGTSPQGPDPKPPTYTEQ